MRKTRVRATRPFLREDRHGLAIAPQKLTTLQALRAFATLNVVMLHAQIAADAAGIEPHLLGVPSGQGASGVDLFFVISGFIMVHVQGARRPSPAAFPRERPMRVAPLYWALTLLLWALLLAAPSLFARFHTSAGQVLVSLPFLSQRPGHGVPAFYVRWTLELEMMFYALFAASLLLPDLRASAAATAGFPAVGIVAFGLPSICAEFAMGMAAGLVRARDRRTPRVGIAALILDASCSI